MNAVQIKHPITGYWLKVSTITGRIIGERKKPYAVPVKPMHGKG